MTYDLTKFDLGDMLKCSVRLRETAADAPTLESSAQRVCRFLYDELADREENGNARSSAATRPRVRVTGAGSSGFCPGGDGCREPQSSMKCLTLMASVGETAVWNSRFLSRGHRAIPLPSPEIVEKAPMIAQLIKELGLDLSALLRPSPDVVRELAGKRYGVFHVENALGSPYIPAQEEFVQRYGIKSVLGFGGMLPNGELFAVICSRTSPFLLRRPTDSAASPWM